MSEGAAPVDTLIVDDNPPMIRLLAELLADEGYRVLTLGGGTVVETALLHTPRLLMLDLLLPELDGPAICQRLRADPRTAQVPNIFHLPSPRCPLRLLPSACTIARTMR